MTDKEYRQLISKANRRLELLEKNRFTGHAYKLAPLIDIKSGRRRFSGKIAKMSVKERVEQYKQIQKFLAAKTSTITGALDVEEQRARTLLKKYNVDYSFKNSENIQAFLYSKEFEQLKKYRDSNQLIEDFLTIKNGGEHTDEILEKFDEWINASELTFDELIDTMQTEGWWNSD